MLTVLFLIFIALLPDFAIRFPEYIDWNTLCLIVFYIVLSRAFIMSGVADNLALRIVGISGNLYKLHYLIIFTAILVSFLATNDRAVLIMTPLIISTSRLLRRDYRKLVILVLLAANTGSIMLPFSNPQNIIIWQYYELPIHSVLRVTIPLMTILLIILSVIVFCLVSKEEHLKCGSILLPKIKVRKSLAYSSIVLLFLGAILGEYRCSVLALLIEMVILLIIDWRVFKGIDYGLILSFF